MPLPRQIAVTLAVLALSHLASAQALVDLDRPPAPGAFSLASPSKAAAIYIAPANPETVKVAAQAFASDIEQVTGTRPRILDSLTGPPPENLILVGVLGQSPEIDRLAAAGTIDTSAVAGHWEAALTQVVPFSGATHTLVIAANDRRGAAYALFALSRQIGVSPWTWWADVPIPHHSSISILPAAHVQPSPSVQYRGIFLNDEDWGLRPWAARKMDPTVDGGKGNIGPHTYARIFELLLRLHANSLWPAMHPGTLAFNAVPENAVLADRWGIVMGASHSEALLRNNVGEWSEKPPPAGDGPWNYQTNAPAMRAYWEKRVAANGKYENFYTVGLRGLHDSGLEATGAPEVKAKLVEDAMSDQRAILSKEIRPDLAKIPQVIWLYKESLDLYRAGMQVPEDVTLGWTDDNYGYIRELPTVEEQKRPGGSGVYYHVSYWGAPHDYLWLCTTPPALIREEMTKAYDHNARRYWILNVGDLKPAEMDIDYFMQLAVDEPRMAQMSQHDFLTQWFSEQFPTSSGISGAPGQTVSPSDLGIQGSGKPGAPLMTAPSSWVGSKLADVMTDYYRLNFIRKPEFMGFNGYNDGINRTAFNPLAWGTHGQRDQNRARFAEWNDLRNAELAIAKIIPTASHEAFFELVGYPIEASAAQDAKFLTTDMTYLDAYIDNPSVFEIGGKPGRTASAHNAMSVATDLTYLDTHTASSDELANDTRRAHAAYDIVQTLTAQYSAIENGKWSGIMSESPRERHVFEMPRTATLADAATPLPAAWVPGPPVSPPIAPGFVEQNSSVSIDAAHYARHSDGTLARWITLHDLGISGPSVVYGSPGLLANAHAAPPAPDAPWLEYDFTTLSSGAATLTLHLLPTFPVDSAHRLRYAVSIDGHPLLELDAAAPLPNAKPAAAGDGPANSGWAEAVLRNSATATMKIATLPPGTHTLRLLYRDPGVVFEHLVLTFPGAPPAYPVPPETGQPTQPR